MSNFAEVYKQLNTAQKNAVDTIFGPVLVIAGPGTGKTQLLSARVANILQKTDAQPQNILCLTFTENGAQNMRERLGSFIGSNAYDVAIGTYHSFGSTIISRYPEYFTDLRLERPIDELGKHQLLAEIIDAVDYRSPIKQIRHHLGDLMSTISEVKRGLLSADDLRIIAAENMAVIVQTAPAVREALAPFVKRLPGKLDVALPLYQAILAALEAANKPTKTTYPHYAKLAAESLSEAIHEAEESGKTQPFTKWKKDWLVKDEDNQYILAGALEARRITALADVVEAYQKSLSKHGLYDFDDMILRAVDALEQNSELRYSLQEQYQFILLDEFQDTNAAQLKLVELLTNNPVSEGMPNVLAVGDDDQAIYAFQGAEAGNMLDFFKLYRDVRVISLAENYRSKPEILEAASNVAGQIDTRLHAHFPGVTKQLNAKMQAKEAVQLNRHAYTSAVAEQVAVAHRITELISDGVAPADIAVLAPKHKYLEPLVPYLQSNDIAVSYEKRENVLDAPVVRQLLTMSRLVLALHRNKLAIADSLWPEVLSYDFWDFSTSDIWQIAWRASDTRQPWTKLLLESSEFKHAALVFLTLASKVETETLEYMLDALIGTNDIQTRDRTTPSVRSPLRSYYFERAGDSILYETVTQLTVLRARLREHQVGEGRMLGLADIVEYVAAYEAAGQQMVNTSPYNQSADAVKLMTVFKAKGLEFAHVFLVACDDSVWGTRSTGVGNKLKLPANLAAIRHAGANDDERLRLLFVAMTRAKIGLHLTSHSRTYNGKATEAIKYFAEVENEKGTRETGILPTGFMAVVTDDSQPPSLEALTMNWHARHLQPETSLRELLRERLATYKLSPTHLMHFIDLKYGGPDSFLLGTLLRFPSAPTIETSFGNTIHDVLEWVQTQVSKNETLPSSPAIAERIERFLATQELTEAQKQQQTERAVHVIEQYLKKGPRYFKVGNIAEKSFRDEGVFVGDAHMGGKIDLLVVDKMAKRITVVDYKTGQLGTDPTKLHRYTLQLYCYKLLVEGSHTFSGYTVDEGKILFVEPNAEGAIIEKTITFEQTELQRVKQLIEAMWHRVQTLDMPDISGYKDSLTDIRAFEDFLIDSIT